MSNKKWERFERLVASINATKMKEANVKWNDFIEGRQFDVTARFKIGDFNYLTVIECKDYSSKISVEKVEAFVTKSIGVKANKAVIVSSSGFQSGCRIVAERYGIELFELSESEELSNELLNALVTPAINLYDIILVQNGKRENFKLGDGPKLPYLVSNITIAYPSGIIMDLDAILSTWGSANFQSLSYSPNVYKVCLPSNSIVKIPDRPELINVKYIELKACIVDAKVMKEPSLDRYLLAKQNKKIILSEFVSGEKSEIKFVDINHGFDTVFKEGKFYHSVNLDFNYYCEKIDGNLVHWILLESYQHGRKLDVRFSATKENSIGYVEVVSNLKLGKLKKYLKKFYRNEKNDKKI